MLTLSPYLAICSFGLPILEAIQTVTALIAGDRTQVYNTTMEAAAKGSLVLWGFFSLQISSNKSQGKLTDDFPDGTVDLSVILGSMIKSMSFLCKKQMLRRFCSNQK